MPEALKSIHPDGTTRHGFRWPDAGPVICDDAIDPDNRGPCPTREGDGVCLGKTFYGMAMGGIPAEHLLTVRYRQKDVLGEDADKLRVRCCAVMRRWTLPEWLAANRGADLRGADLRGADLPASHAHLQNPRSHDGG